MFSWENRCLKTKKGLASVLSVSQVEKAGQGVESTAELERILRNAGVLGVLELSSHFKMRTAQRKFTTVEALQILRRGEISGVPEFIPDFCNWSSWFKVNMILARCI